MSVSKVFFLSALAFVSECLAIALLNTEPTAVWSDSVNAIEARALSFNQAAQPTTFLKIVSSSSNLTALETVLVTTSGQSTWSETFIETSLSQFATVTTPTTFTTADASGNVALGLAFAGGLAWLGIPAPLPPIDPPPDAPTPSPVASSGITSTASTSFSAMASSASSSSTTSLKATQTAVRQFAHPSAQALLAAVKSARIVPNDVIACAPSPTAAVNRDQALIQLSKFCEAQDGKQIDAANRTSQEFDMGAGILLQASLHVSTACSGLSINGNNGTCSSAFRQVIDNCDTKSAQKHGGLVSDGCTTFTAEVMEHQGTNLTCHGSSSPDTGIRRDNAVSNIQAFCKMNSGSKVSPGAGNTFTYGQPAGNDQAVLSITYSDSCTRQGSPTYSIDETACNRFLTTIIDGCDTGTTTAKFGGNLTDHCGVYSFQTQLVEKITCGNNPLISGMPFSSSDAASAIKEYCNKKLTLNPTVTSDGNFHQNVPPGMSFDNFLDNGANLRINLNASFITDQTGCLAKPAAFSTQGDECIRKLTGIINSCDTQTTTKKIGGVLLDNTAHGCVRWSIFGSCTSNTGCIPL